jgi:hypothetical protein
MAARLDEYDKTEWRDVCRKFRPDWTDEEFDAEWEQNLALREARRVLGGMN